MVHGTAPTTACSIRNTSMGFIVESDGTEGKDSSTENMRHIDRGGIGCPNKSTRFNFVIKCTIYSKSADIFISV